jgi:hypothetical protein
MIGLEGLNKAFWIEARVCSASASRAAVIPDH